MSTRQVDLVWGVAGFTPLVDVQNVVIVDVLSFSSAVDAACSRGAVVYPYPWKDQRVTAFANTVGARVAVQRQDATGAGPSLSPPSLLGLPVGARLVLPSPNGSTLAAMSGAGTTVTGCLRNAGAVASYVNSLVGDVVVVAAGERWPDQSLRPALEDLIGAGSIVGALDGDKTPDARAAVAAFDTFKADLSACLKSTPSGQELIGRGYGDDVEFSVQYNVSNTVPLLSDGCFQAIG